MRWVKLIFAGALISISTGAFGRYPFINSKLAISLVDLFLFLSVAYFLSLKFFHRTKIFIPKNFRWIIIFWGICVLSLLGSLTLLKPVDIVGGVLYLLRFIVYSFSIILVYNLYKDKILAKAELINLFLGVGVLLAILGFVQLYFIPKLDDFEYLGFDPHKMRLVSTWLDPNFLGGFLVLSLGLALYKVDRGSWGSWGVLAVLLVSIILTFSRSAYLMLGIFGLIYGFKKKVVWVGLGVLLVALVVSPTFLQRVKSGFFLDPSAYKRVLSYERGIEVIKINPLIGVGFNNLRVVQNKLNLFETEHVGEGRSASGVDSGLLFVLATTGTLGLLFYSLFWFYNLQDLLSKKENLSFLMFALLLGLIVNGQFINSLFFPPIMLWYFSMLGVLV